MSDISIGRFGTIGLDPKRSILFAQVLDSNPRMSYNDEKMLQQKGAKDAKGKVFLGDVANAAIRSIGYHEPPVFTKEPDYDEQRWEIVCKSENIQMKISSIHYWGFGLFTRCFLNEIVIEGPIGDRARCVFDMVSSLGRNPWEPTRVKAFERATSSSISSHSESWQNMLSLAKEEMNLQINQIQDSISHLRGKEVGSDEFLDKARDAITRAREALSEKNAFAVERALSRASSWLIQANQLTEIENSDLFIESD